MSSIVVTSAPTNCAALALVSTMLQFGAASFALLTLPIALLGNGISKEILTILKEGASASQTHLHTNNNGTTQKEHENLPHTIKDTAIEIQRGLKELWETEKANIARIRNEKTRGTLMNYYHQAYQQYLGQLNEGTIPNLDSILHSLRIKIKEIEIEENSWLLALRDFETFCGFIENDYPDETLKARKQLKELEHFPFNTRFSDLMNLFSQLRTLKKGADSPENEERIRLEVQVYAKRIEQLDLHTYNGLLPLIKEVDTGSPYKSRLPMIHQRIKLVYTFLRENIAQTESYKDELKTILPSLASIPGSEKLRDEMGQLMQSKFIEQAHYLSLYERARRFIWETQKKMTETYLIDKVSTTLKNLGYELDTGMIHPDQIVYLKSPYEGYPVMFKISKGGEIAFRLVRQVATEEEKTNITAYQRQKDREIGEKWCTDFNRFMEQMHDLNLDLHTLLRKEPEESELIAIVDRNYSTKATRKKTLNPVNEKKGDI